MKENLVSFLVLEGFTPLATNLPDFSVFLKKEFSHVNVLFLAELEAGSNCTEKRFEEVKKSAVELLRKQGLTLELHILSILLAADAEHALEICASDSRCWVIDNRRRELIVGEDKIEDFYGLKGMLQSFLRNPDAAGERLAKINREVENEIRRLEQKSKRPLPYATIVLGAINVLLTVADLMSGYALTEYLGLETSGFAWQKCYQLITHAFLHWDLFHLAGNMLILYVAGEMLEQKFGKGKLVLLYLSSAFVSGICSLYYFTMRGEAVLAIGASGAVYGLLGAVIVLLLTAGYKNRRYPIFRIVMMILCVIAVIYDGVLQENVNYVGHISGVCFGAIVMLTVVLVNVIWKGRKHEG